MNLNALWIARALALLWAGFWLLFVIVESLVWNTPLSVMMVWVAVGLLFLLAALIAWWSRRVGGVLLIVVGSGAAGVYALQHPQHLPLISVVVTIVVLAGPPAIAGILFLRK